MTKDLFVVLHRRFVDGDDFHRWEKVDFVESEIKARNTCLSPGVDYSVGDIFGFLKIEEVSDVHSRICNNELFIATEPTNDNAIKKINIASDVMRAYERADANYHKVMSIAGNAPEKRILAATAVALAISTRHMRGDKSFAVAVKLAMEYVVDYCFGERSAKDLEEADNYIKKQTVNNNSIFFRMCRDILALNEDRMVIHNLSAQLIGMNAAMINLDQMADLKHDIAEVVRHYIPYNIIALAKLGVEIPMKKVTE